MAVRKPPFTHVPHPHRRPRIPRGHSPFHRPCPTPFTLTNPLRSPSPSQIIRKAVSSMLPKNTFRQRRLDRLKIFKGEENPYAGNVVRVFRGETPPPPRREGEERA